MKKVLVILVALIGIGISVNARTPQSGKYCSSDNSYVIVDGANIYLYIDGYSAGKFTITRGDDTDNPSSPWFTFADSSGKEHNGEYQKFNGEYVLKLGGRKLKGSNCR